MEFYYVLNIELCQFVSRISRVDQNEMSGLGETVYDDPYSILILSGFGQSRDKIHRDRSHFHSGISSGYNIHVGL